MNFFKRNENFKLSDRKGLLGKLLEFKLFKNRWLTRLDSASIMSYVSPQGFLIKPSLFGYGNGGSVTRGPNGVVSNLANSSRLGFYWTDRFWRFSNADFPFSNHGSSVMTFDSFASWNFRMFDLHSLYVKYDFGQLFFQSNVLGGGFSKNKRIVGYLFFVFVLLLFFFFVFLLSVLMIFEYGYPSWGGPCYQLLGPCGWLFGFLDYVGSANILVLNNYGFLSWMSRYFYLDWALPDVLYYDRNLVFFLEGGAIGANYFLVEYFLLFLNWYYTLIHQFVSHWVTLFSFNSLSVNLTAPSVYQYQTDLLWRFFASFANVGPLLIEVIWSPTLAKFNWSFNFQESFTLYAFWVDGFRVFDGAMFLYEQYALRHLVFTELRFFSGLGYDSSAGSDLANYWDYVNFILDYVVSAVRNLLWGFYRANIFWFLGSVWWLKTTDFYAMFVGNSEFFVGGLYLLSLLLVSVSVSFFLWLLFLLYRNLLLVSDSWMYLTRWLYTKDEDLRLLDVEANKQLLGSSYRRWSSPSFRNAVVPGRGFSGFYNSYELKSSVALEETFGGYTGFLNAFPSQESIVDVDTYLFNRVTSASFYKKFKSAFKGGFFIGREFFSLNAGVKRSVLRSDAYKGFSFFGGDLFTTPRFYSFLFKPRFFSALNAFNPLYFWSDPTVVGARKKLSDLEKVDYDVVFDYSSSDDLPGHDLDAHSEALPSDWHGGSYSASESDYWDQEELNRFLAANHLRRHFSDASLRTFSFGAEGLVNDYIFRDTLHNFDNQFEPVPGGDARGESEDEDMFEDPDMDSVNDTFYRDNYLHGVTTFHDFELEEELEEEGVDDLDAFLRGARRLNSKELDYDKLEEELELNEGIDADVSERGWGQEVDYSTRTTSSDYSGFVGLEYGAAINYSEGLLNSVYDDVSDGYWLNSDLSHYGNFFVFPASRFLNVAGGGFGLRRFGWILRKFSGRFFVFYTKELGEGFFGEKGKVFSAFKVTAFVYLCFCLFVVLNFLVFLILYFFYSFLLCLGQVVVWIFLLLFLLFCVFIFFLFFFNVTSAFLGSCAIFLRLGFFFKILFALLFVLQLVTSRDLSRGASTLRDSRLDVVSGFSSSLRSFFSNSGASLKYSNVFALSQFNGIFFKRHLKFFLLSPIYLRLNYGLSPVKGFFQKQQLITSGVTSSYFVGSGGLPSGISGFLWWSSGLGLLPLSDGREVFGVTRSGVGRFEYALREFMVRVGFYSSVKLDTASYLDLSTLDNYSGSRVGGSFFVSVFDLVCDSNACGIAAHTHSGFVSSSYLSRFVFRVHASEKEKAFGVFSKYSGGVATNFSKSGFSFTYASRERNVLTSMLHRSFDMPDYVYRDMNSFVPSPVETSKDVGRVSLEFGSMNQALSGEGGRFGVSGSYAGVAAAGPDLAWRALHPSMSELSLDYYINDSCSIRNRNYSSFDLLLQRGQADVKLNSFASHLQSLILQSYSSTDAPFRFGFNSFREPASPIKFDAAFYSSFFGHSDSVIKGLGTFGPFVGLKEYWLRGGGRKK